MLNHGYRTIFTNAAIYIYIYIYRKKERKKGEISDVFCE